MKLSLHYAGVSIGDLLCDCTITGTWEHEVSKTGVKPNRFSSIRPLSFIFILYRFTEPEKTFKITGSTKTLKGNKVGKNGGRSRNRTGVHGVAVRCITTLPSGHQDL